MEKILELSGVSRHFKEHAVLEDFSMELLPGQVKVIRGPSGSGKTTLLNIIGLLDQPDAGTVRLFGQENVRPFSGAARKLLRNKIGYLFQNFALLENRTVLYNLALAYGLRKPADWKNQVRSALEQVGLSGMEKKKVSECSGGEQQRIALARLLLKPCELILADEPTGSLDPANRDAVMNHLQMLQKQGKSILVVSHDPQMETIADEVIEIRPLQQSR